MTLHLYAALDAVGGQVDFGVVGAAAQAAWDAARTAWESTHPGEHCKPVVHAPVHMGEHLRNLWNLEANG